MVANLLFGSVDLSFFSWSSLSLKEQSLLKELTLEMRLPRTLLAFFAGGASAIAGLILQTVFKNPLAGPTTLGINSVASLGIALFYFVLSSLGYVATGGGEMLLAIVGALTFLFLIVLVALRFKSVSTVLIVGVLLGYVAFSIIEILVQGGSEMEISQYVFWGMGSFNNASWINVGLISMLSCVLFFYFLKQANTLNLYLLGDDELIMNGKVPKKIRLQLITATGVLIGLLTSIVGPLAFLGIAVPNFLKLQLRTLNHVVLLPYVALLGGGFAVFADLLSRGVVFAGVYPLNAVLSILAIPVVVFILLKKKNGTEG